MISAAYPFWFNVALQVGRLLNLQDQITQKQIVNRLKEKYGDRPTISRYARYTIRSFIAWGVLKDSNTRGCYEKVAPLLIEDQQLASILIESGLLSIPNEKIALKEIIQSPAFFPFQFPILPIDQIKYFTPRIEEIRYGLDEEFVRLIK